MSACQHIADFYQMKWREHPCIGFNFLRLGYREWAEGRPSKWNNLYDLS